MKPIHIQSDLTMHINFRFDWLLQPFCWCSCHGTASMADCCGASPFASYLLYVRLLKMHRTELIFTTPTSVWHELPPALWVLETYWPPFIFCPSFSMRSFLWHFLLRSQNNSQDARNHLIGFSWSFSRYSCSMESYSSV